MSAEGEREKLKQFLLGSLSESDAEEIGVQIITDGAMDEKMSFAETELIEDFLDNELTAQEKELFFANFLTTPERVELLEETALLKNCAQNYFKAEAEGEREEKKSGSFIDGFRRFLALNLRPIAAVLLVLVIGAVVWRVFLYDANALSQVEKEYAALNAKDLTSAPEAANLTNKSLIVGTYRDTADASSKLSAAALTGNVLFRLALPPETPRDTRFDLELIKDGKAVFRQPNLKVYQNPSGQELKVILPKSVLSSGTYQIKLNTGATYVFAVE